MSMDGPSPVVSKVHTIVGPLLIAVTVNTFLYGVCFLQLVRYFTSGSRDHLSMKLFIAWELVIDTFHSAILIYTMWKFVVSNFANEAFLDTTPWSLTSTPALTALSACPVQIFLSYRVKKLSGSWTVFIILLLLSLAEGTLGIAVSTETLRAKKYILSADNLNRWPDHCSYSLAALIRTITILDSWTAVSVAADVTISASLIYYLRKRRTGVRHMDYLISRLIREVIESASFASFFSIMVLITSILWPATQIVTVFTLPVGRVYTNTFLAILNSRQSLQRELHENIHSSRETESNYGERMTGEISTLNRNKGATGVQSMPATAGNNLSFTIISTDTDDI
ncbi:hypothetical protein GYMLUDRAFT_240685 [Collybiopsis luxurians FD-317 M1]|nr:hypothetical protein GYMLUDRAFT_240685 [Collybiopsis luxurians FD-317 M1]